MEPDDSTAAGSGAYGDAFKDDLREERVKGKSLVEEHSHVSAAVDEDLRQELIAESKCNNVSFMKLEPLPPDCRSVLAVSDAYICYAVTQKRNLLRIIDSQSGEKSLLRGHQHCVADLRFSPVDANYICSIDAGDSAMEVDNTVHHVFFWRKVPSSDWEKHTSLPLVAHRVVAHPSRSNLWALLSDGSCNICIVDTDATESNKLKSAALAVGERATDATFSEDGAQLVVTIATPSTGGNNYSYRVQLYALSYTSAGGWQLQKIYSASQATQLVLATSPESVLLGVQCLPQQHLLTVTSTTTSSYGIGGKATEDSVSYVLTVWRCPFVEIKNAAADAGSIADRMFSLPYVVQSLTVDLPRHQSGGSKSSISRHDCALSLEPKRRRYVVLTSRRSALAACISVAPGTGQRVLNHISFLNLHAPVLSVDAITVLGQQHHSAEAGEHMELSCYQEAAAADPNQSSIQQYFALFAHIFPKRSRVVEQTPLADINEILKRGVKKPEDEHRLVGEENSKSQAKPGLSILNILSRHSTTTSAIDSTLPTPGIVPVPKISSTLSAGGKSDSPAGAVEGSEVSNKASRNILETLRAASGKSTATSTPDRKKDSDLHRGADAKNELPSFLFTQPNESTSALGLLKSGDISKKSDSIAAKTVPASSDISVVPIGSAGNSTSTDDLLHQVRDVMEQLKATSSTTPMQQNQLQSSVKAAVEQSFLGTGSKNIKGSLSDKISSDVASAVGTALEKQVVPKLCSQLEQSLKQQLKAQLSTAVKQHFESSILPALQTGMRTAFQQIEAACQLGFTALQRQTAEVVAHKQRENESLRKEVSELHIAMRTMQAQLEVMSDKLDTIQNKQRNEIADSSVMAEEHTEDAMALLKKGLVAEAVMRALEEKTIVKIIEVLSQLTPAVVNEKCSRLVRLCITQQLAADMSEAIPQEGVGGRVEWIKNLVLPLLSSSGNSANTQEDAHFEAHFKGMIAAVLESIQAAKKMILNAALDNGDDDSTAVPPSVGIDLQMLELIIQSKM